MIDTSIPAGATGTGEMPESAATDLRKALTAGYGTDMNTLTGGAALRIQSLDPIMQATIVESQHFKLFAKLAKTKPTATVDEWTEQSGIGGFLGGTASGEVDPINVAQGVYNRRTGMVKYLMTRAEVSIMQTFQNTIVDSEAAEYHAASMRLMQDVEYFLFEGNSAIVPTQFDGIKAQLLSGVALGQVDPGNVIDMAGQPLNSIHPINMASAQARGMGNFGQSTDIFWPLAVQVDMDNALDPAFRVPLSSVGDPGIKIGAPVIGVRTSGGNIATQEDIFIPSSDDRQPFELRNPTQAVGNVGMKPASVTAAASSEASSKFGATHAGNYYYAVASISRAGQSPVLVSAQQAVSAGQKVVLSISRSAGQQESGYVIFRSRQNGPALVGGSFPGEGSDFREIGRVGVVGNTTTFTDMNVDIPGTVEAYVLNLTPSATAITWRQFCPMFKLPLATVDAPVIRWAQILAGYLRMTKRRHHVLLKNILPNSAAWRPFA
jgi:hypothetical protein